MNEGVAENYYHLGDLERSVLEMNVRVAIMSGTH